MKKRDSFELTYCHSYADEPAPGCRRRPSGLCGNRATFMVLLNTPSDGIDYLSPSCAKHARMMLDEENGGFPSIPMPHFRKIWAKIGASRKPFIDKVWQIAALIDPACDGDYPKGSMFRKEGVQCGN